MTLPSNDTLLRLDAIGGWVGDGEVAYHLGPDAVYELLEAAEADQPFVEVRTEFSLTERGKAALHDLHPREQLDGRAPEAVGEEPQASQSGDAGSTPASRFTTQEGTR